MDIHGYPGQPAHSTSPVLIIVRGRVLQRIFNRLCPQPLDLRIKLALPYHNKKLYIPHPNLIKLALPYHKKLYHTTSQFNQNSGNHRYFTGKS